ncbi:uncharacterized protein LOC119771737 [Cyprinodon tularosa]|uniref:uncharacterized protein LOC119771737 n=1 Tax=Cyprinodon tularosa TaxID=77115 RepID=UPI0018E21DD6|nr:uncharacterized protein LOC119771737 [Cyprinodon tularosa]
MASHINAKQGTPSTSRATSVHIVAEPGVQPLSAGGEVGDLESSMHSLSIAEEHRPDSPDKEDTNDLRNTVHSLWKWHSQPTLRFGMQGGDFMLSANILLSGNNYRKVALLFKFMAMGMVSVSTFFRIQDAYCIEPVQEYWDKTRAEVLESLRQKDRVVVLGDGRMDSPGHCAQFCTYTTIEQDSRDIVHIVSVDKRETNRNSVIMEKECFIRTMEALLPELAIKEVVTDAHPQSSALLNPERGKYKAWGIQHSLDIWHAAKSLSKKLRRVGTVKNQTIIQAWIKDIVNHFWYCSKHAVTEEQFKMMWVGVLHHVRDEHSWATGCCQHEPLEEGSQEKP